MTFGVPFKGLTFEVDVQLESQTTPGTFQTNPTLASGDVKITKDNGALANLATLPVVSPASSKNVKVALSATEMAADRITIIFSDAAGTEWYDRSIIIPTSPIVASLVNDASATTTVFVTDLTETTTDHYKGLFVVFLTGVLIGQAKSISAYNGSTKAITVGTAFTDAPGDNDKFMLIGHN